MLCCLLLSVLCLWVLVCNVFNVLVRCVCDLLRDVAWSVCSNVCFVCDVVCVVACVFVCVCVFVGRCVCVWMCACCKASVCVLLVISRVLLHGLISYLFA